MSASAQTVINTALAQVGGYYPNKSPYGEWYDSTFAKNSGVYDSAPFCAMGLSWVFAQAGAADIFPMHAYTPSGVSAFKARGQWHDGTKGIQPGDVLYFDFPGAPNRVSHNALALSSWKSGVDTVEFNTSGTAAGDQRNSRVVARKRRTASVVGYGRPAYGSDEIRRESTAADSKKPFIIPTMHRGVESEYVDDWQHSLYQMGYTSVGLADGDFGPKTEQATRNFQAAVGLQQDGAAGPLTVSASLLRDGDRMLAEGDNGADVVLLQFIVGANPDAVFGTQTRAAVQAVQRGFGVSPDGVVGPIFVQHYRKAAS